MPALHLIKNYKLKIKQPFVKGKNSLQSKGYGFTLVELMVAISIIAILAAVGITSFSQSQKLGRDARRKQDLRSLSVALELYFQKFGHYPCVVGAGGGWLYSGATQTNWITNYTTEYPTTCGTGGTLDTQYINRVPIDPLNKADASLVTSNTALGYGYYSPAIANVNGSTCSKGSGQYYLLIAGLENASDPESFSKKPPVWCEGTTITGYGTNKFVITSW